MATASTLKILESPTTGEIPQLAHDLALALDPVCLAERIGLYPDKWQRDVLRSTAGRQIWLAARQSGKSTTVAVMAVHQALYVPNSLVLLLSPSLRQSGELYRDKVLPVYRALGRPVSAESETALTLRLENGSRIVSLPGTEETVRGFSGVALLIVDEASRVDDALYHAVRPMLAVSHGKLVLLSTPWGKRGFFYREWAEGGAHWQRTKVTALDCPRIPPEFLEEERAALPDLFFSSEYLCQFSDTVNQVFATEDIEAAISDEVQPLFASVPVALEESCEPLFVR